MTIGTITWNTQERSEEEEKEHSEEEEVVTAIFAVVDNVVVTDVAVRSVCFLPKALRFSHHRYLRIQRTPAIAHFKGLTNFMPYCRNALLPGSFLALVKNK